MMRILSSRRRGGFTLLELIVVITVLGVLAAIAVPTFDRVQQASADRAAETVAQAIARNANAIASADGSGGVVDGTILGQAAGEVDDSGALLTVSPDGSEVDVEVESGSYTSRSTVSIVSGVATAGEASEALAFVAQTSPHAWISGGAAPTVSAPNGWLFKPSPTLNVYATKYLGYLVSVNGAAFELFNGDLDVITNSVRVHLPEGVGSGDRVQIGYDYIIGDYSYNSPGNYRYSAIITLP